MKKYFLRDNKQEVKLGDKVDLFTTTDTPYGEGRTTVVVTLTEKMLKQLIEDGLIIEKEDATSEYDFVNSIKPYIRRFARKNGLTFPNAITFLQLLSVLCKKAHLDVLVEMVSEAKNRGKQMGEEVYFLNALNGYYPKAVRVADVKYLPSMHFYDAKDALDARKLLLPVIEDILDGE